MTREAVQAKAARYLTGGRLTVKLVSGGVIEAHCKGGGQVYALGFDGSAWWCACPARTTCAHLLALQAVTVAGDAAALSVAS